MVTVSSNIPSKKSSRISGYSKSATSILILFVGIYLAIRWQDAPLMESFGDGIGILVQSILLLLLAGVVALLNRLFFKPPHRQRIGETVGWLVVIGNSMILSAILFMVGVTGIDHWKFVVAQNYVANAVPVLDAIRAQKGTYPVTLRDAKLGQLPANLSFSSNGTVYGFLYFDEDGEGIFEFDTNNKTWRFEAP